MFLLSIVLTFSLQFLSSVAKPENQLGFKCTNVSNPQNYGCPVKGNVLRFFVIGDIGGEEYTVEDEQHQCTVEGHVTVADCEKNNCPTVVKHRPTEAQKAVAKAMDLLATSNGVTPREDFLKVFASKKTKKELYKIANGEMAPHFLLNVGDNFYEKGVTFEDVKKRFEENFTKVYHQDSLNVPWFTIAGNNDWESKDGIKPQIEQIEGKWTFPAQNYVVNYEFGESADKRKTARFIMIDTTVLCGSGSTVFGKMKKKEDKQQQYAKMIEDAKTHFKWLRKELREAKRRRVHFLFLVGHCPLHILDKLPGARLYPCARRVMALMRFFQVQAYFAGHSHSLKHADLSSSKHGIRTKYIVSGAGSRMENAINEDRFPAEYLEEGYMKFLYPNHVGKRPMIDGEISKARENVALDGGAFVGVEIDAEKRVGKLNFYAAGMLYKENGEKVTDEKVPIGKWHKFEGQEIELLPRKIDMTDENDNICNEFLALIDADEMKDDEHFKMDETQRIQAKLGKYFCKNMKENEKNEQNHPKEINYKFDWTTVDDVQFYAEEAMGQMRKKFGITYKQLANSFLSDDLTKLNVLGKSSSKFCRTEDERFLLKQIPQPYEVETIEKTLEDYVKHMMQMGDKSFINKIFMVFRVKIESTSTLFLLMENVFKNAKDLRLLNFDVKGVFSYQRELVEVFQEQRLNDVVLKWYHFFGGEPPLVPTKVMPMFPEGILLDKETHHNIAERLKSDFEVLTANNVNDWSIIFGVYFEKNGENTTIAESSDEKSFFNATCYKCKDDPNFCYKCKDTPNQGQEKLGLALEAEGEAQFLSKHEVRSSKPKKLEVFEARSLKLEVSPILDPNSETILKKEELRQLRLYIGIVGIFMPFNETRKEKYIEGFIKKKLINVPEEDSNDLMAYVKTGRIWETFGPIPPPMYADRMLAFSMACAFRWKASSENVVPSEAIRQALISAFCDSYGKSEQLKETEKQLEEAKKKKWTNLMQKEYSIGQYTVTIFGVELFKHLMEQSGKYTWNFLNDLAEDDLKANDENDEPSQKFVVKTFDETMVKETFGNVLKNEPNTFALLSLKVKESDKEKCEFFKVIGKHEDNPKKEDQ